MQDVLVEIALRTVSGPRLRVCVKAVLGGMRTLARGDYRQRYPSREFCASHVSRRAAAALNPDFAPRKNGDADRRDRNRCLVAEKAGSLHAVDGLMGGC